MKKLTIISCSIAISTLFMHGFAQATTQTTGWVKGVIVKIDKPRLHVIIKHAKIPSIAMDAMTMPFKVASLDLLSKVSVGDRVRFELIVDNGTLALVKLEKAK